MKKITKLKLCGRLLLTVTVLMLASSIQQEGWWLGMDYVWIHIVLGIIFFLLIGWHLQLHFQWHNWFARLKRQKSRGPEWLAAFGALTLLWPTIQTSQKKNRRLNC